MRAAFVNAIRSTKTLPPGAFTLGPTNSNAFAGITGILIGGSLIKTRRRRGCTWHADRAAGFACPVKGYGS